MKRMWRMQRKRMWIRRTGGKSMWKQESHGSRTRRGDRRKRKRKKKRRVRRGGCGGNKGKG